MISFRQLIVTIVSIFLALGLGILAGTTIIDQSLVKTLRHETHASEQQSARYKSQRDAFNALVTSLVPVVVSGRLAHKPVILVTDANTDGTALGEATAFLSQAKADVVAQLQVTSSLAPTNPARSALARLLVTDGQPSQGDPSTVAAQALANRIATGPPQVDPKTGKPLGPDLLADLLSAGFLGFPQANPPNPQDVGGPGQAVVVVTGGKRAPAVPFGSFMLPFVEELVTLAVPVEVGEARASSHSFVRALRGVPSLGSTSDLATVDDLASGDPRGGLALVLALRDLLRARPIGGNYGVKDGASALMPGPP